MNFEFDITPKEYTIVLDILYRYLKTPAKIWVFGSRAKHKTKRNSDLDLAIESIEPIPLGVLGYQHPLKNTNPSFLPSPPLYVNAPPKRQIFQ